MVSGKELNHNVCVYFITQTYRNIFENKLSNGKFTKSKY